jgi:hypothetical protein
MSFMRYWSRKDKFNAEYPIQAFPRMVFAAKTVLFHLKNNNYVYNSNDNHVNEGDCQKTQKVLRQGRF